LFARGRYIPLAAGGVFHRHIVAFARQAGDQWCLTAVPRLVSGLVAEGQDPLGPNVWADTRLTLPSAAPRAWRNVFTGKVSLADGGLPVAEILAHFPVALLTGAPSP
jgi:(1->4)-alpha-D-glucan 1-alpha-D-glucosylmutase